MFIGAILDDEAPAALTLPLGELDAELVLSVGPQTVDVLVQRRAVHILVLGGVGAWSVTHGVHATVAHTLVTSQARVAPRQDDRRR